MSNCEKAKNYGSGEEISDRNEIKVFRGGKDLLFLGGDQGLQKDQRLCRGKELLIAIAERTRLTKAMMKSGEEVLASI